jgi:hypothetical protein
MPRLYVLRQHDDGEVWVLVPQQSGCTRPVVRSVRGHPNIDNGQVRLRTAYSLDE